MSEPSQSTDAEPPTEADEDEYPDVDAEPTEGTERTEPTDAGSVAEGASETDSEAAAEDDAEDVESEWHGWILGLLVVAGIAIFFAPGWLVPELLGTLGAFLVAIGALGLVIKWAIERSA